MSLQGAAAAVHVSDKPLRLASLANKPPQLRARRHKLTRPLATIERRPPPPTAPPPLPNSTTHILELARDIICYSKRADETPTSSDDPTRSARSVALAMAAAATASRPPLQPPRLPPPREHPAADESHIATSRAIISSCAPPVQPPRPLEQEMQADDALPVKMPLEPALLAKALLPEPAPLAKTLPGPASFAEPRPRLEDLSKSRRLDSAVWASAEQQELAQARRKLVRLEREARRSQLEAREMTDEAQRAAAAESAARQQAVEAVAEVRMQAEAALVQERRRAEEAERLAKSAERTMEARLAAERASFEKSLANEQETAKAVSRRLLEAERAAKYWRDKCDSAEKARLAAVATNKAADAAGRTAVQLSAKATELALAAEDARRAAADALTVAATPEVHAGRHLARRVLGREPITARQTATQIAALERQLVGATHRERRARNAAAQSARLLSRLARQPRLDALWTRPRADKRSSEAGRAARGAAAARRGGSTSTVQDTPSSSHGVPDGPRARLARDAAQKQLEILVEVLRQGTLSHSETLQSAGAEAGGSLARSISQTCVPTTAKSPGAKAELPVARQLLVGAAEARNWMAFAKTSAKCGSSTLTTVDLGGG